MRYGLKRKQVRREDGVIADGVCGIIIVTLGFVFGILLLLNTAAAIFYKNKLNHVVSQVAAEVGSQISYNMAFDATLTQSRLERQAVQMVNAKLALFGLPRASNVKLRIVAPSVLGRQGSEDEQVVVIAKLDQLPLFGDNKFLAPISIEESAAYVVPNEQPPALITLKIGGTPVTLPAYGRFVNGFSNGDLPGIAAPPGTAVFRNFHRNYAQFNIAAQSGSFSETVITLR
jgi:hypothetical protein